MKTITSLRYLLFIFLLPLLSCGDDDKPNPAPATPHVVSVRVFGSDLSGLGAELQITSKLVSGGQTQEGPDVSDKYSDAIDKTYSVGTFSNSDVVTVNIAFKNVTRTSTTRPSLTSGLAATILVDGRPQAPIVLDTKGIGSGVRYEPYLAGTTAVQMDQL